MDLPVGVTDYSPSRVPSSLPAWTGKKWDMASYKCAACTYWIGVSAWHLHYGSKACQDNIKRTARFKSIERR